MNLGKFRFQIIDGKLNLNLGKEWEEVKAIPCFPEKFPYSFLAIQNQNGDQVGLIQNIENINQESKKIILDYLKEFNTSMEITKILKLEEKFELRALEVETQLGNRIFYMDLEDWPIQKGNHSFIFKDIGNDTYYLKDLNKLDKKSKKILAPLID